MQSKTRDRDPTWLVLDSANKNLDWQRGWDALHGETKIQKKYKKKIPPSCLVL